MNFFRHKDFILLKLHEFQENFKNLQPIYELDEERSPINLTLKFLDEEFPVEEGSKKHQQRINSLTNSCDDLPMHVVLVDKSNYYDYVTKSNEIDIELVGHCHLLCVAGKPKMTYLDDFVINKSFRRMGFGRYFFKSVEEFLKLELDQDSFGIASKTEVDKSFFHHMGMNQLPGGEKIPYIEVKKAGQKGQLLKKLNSFFSVAEGAMDRKHDLEKVWMTKDLFHFNLCGTDGYKARLEAINEANKKIQAELAQRLAGTNYKKTVADTTGHAGVFSVASSFGTIRQESAPAKLGNRRESAPSKF